MLLSLVDVFRCPADHEESALVLSVDEWRDGRVDRGTLGCPVCHARYAIVDSAVDFRRDPNGPLAPEPEVADTDPERLRALLNLVEPGGIVLLGGRYAALGAPLADADVTCLTIGSTAPAGASIPLRVDARIPVATGTLRAAAVESSDSRLLEDVARAVRPGGRLVGPASIEPPADVQVLARDASDWVGEVAPSAPVVTLRRSSR